MNLRPIALGATILLLASGVASAQPKPLPSGMMGGGHSGGMAHERPDPAAMAKRHADHLRAALQLTPAQEPALAALIASMKPPADPMDGMDGEHDAMATLTTPQRMDKMLAKMDEHRAAMVEHAAAVKRFYAQLSPGQQKAFDVMHQGHDGPMGGRMGGMRGPMGREMGPGHPG